MYKPTIKLTLEKIRKTADKTPVAVEEPTPDYIAVAEEATARLGKKLVVGVVVILATYVVLATAGQIAINALDNPTE